jgi:hypothetical protein
MRIIPVHGCFDNSDGLSNMHMPSWCHPRSCELTNGLRLGTIVLIRDLSGVLALIKHRFHVPTCRVNVGNNYVLTLSTHLVP